MDSYQNQFLLTGTDAISYQVDAPEVQAFGTLVKSPTVNYAIENNSDTAQITISGSVSRNNILVTWHHTGAVSAGSPAEEGWIDVTSCFNVANSDAGKIYAKVCSGYEETITVSSPVSDEHMVGFAEFRGPGDATGFLVDAANVGETTDDTCDVGSVTNTEQLVLAVALGIYRSNSTAANSVDSGFTLGPARISSGNKGLVGGYLVIEDPATVAPIFTLGAGAVQHAGAIALLKGVDPVPPVEPTAIVSQVNSGTALTNGLTDVSVLYSGFSNTITTVSIVVYYNGVELHAIPIVIKSDNGTEIVVDIPDFVSAIYSQGIPFTSSVASLAIRLTDGTNTAEKSVQVNPKTGYAKQDVNTAVNQLGAVSYGFIEDDESPTTIANNAQMYYSTADNTVVYADTVFQTDADSETVLYFLLYNFDLGKWIQQAVKVYDAAVPPVVGPYQTYYVSNTTDNGYSVGNNANNGLGEDTGWLTIVYANTQMNNGDHLIVNAGEYDDFRFKTITTLVKEDDKLNITGSSGKFLVQQLVFFNPIF